MTRLWIGLADFIYNKNNDALVYRAVGLVLSGALILGYASLRLTPKKIGA